MSIDGSVDRALHFAVSLSWNVSATATQAHQIDQMLPIVATIGDDYRRIGQPLKQGRCGGLVGRLALSKRELDRQSALINHNVDLAAQSSTRTADGVIRAPFLPPAACWWARTMELSINCIDCGDDAARASKTRSHTPALAQRL